MSFDEIIGMDEIIGADDENGLVLAGADYLAGAEPDDIESLLASVGALPIQFNPRNRAAAVRQRQLMQRAALQTMATRRAAQGVVVQQRAPQSEGDIPLNFDSGAVLIGAGVTVVVNANPQCLFKPKRLIVPSSIGANFLINDISIMNQSILAAGGVPMSALIFSEQAVGSIHTNKTCQPVGQVQISVTNATLAPARFLGTMYGQGAR